MDIIYLVKIKFFQLKMLIQNLTVVRFLERSSLVWIEKRDFAYAIDGNGKGTLLKLSEKMLCCKGRGNKKSMSKQNINFFLTLRMLPAGNQTLILRVKLENIF